MNLRWLTADGAVAAVIVARPSATPDTVPVESTRATCGLELVHATVRPESSFPLESRAVALSSTRPNGEFESATTATLSGATLTEALVASAFAVVNSIVALWPSASPLRSAAAAATTRVYAVERANSVSGTKSARRPSADTATRPVTGVLSRSSFNVAVVRVRGSIGSLNTTRISELSGMSVPPLGGTVRMTIGARRAGTTTTALTVPPEPAAMTTSTESPTPAARGTGSNPPSSTSAVARKSFDRFRMVALRPPGTVPVGSETQVMLSPC